MIHSHIPLINYLVCCETPLVAPPVPSGPLRKKHPREVHFFETSCAKKEGVDAALTKAPDVNSKTWQDDVFGGYPSVFCTFAVCLVIVDTETIQMFIVQESRGMETLCASFLCCLTMSPAVTSIVKAT